MSTDIDPSDLTDCIRCERSSPLKQFFKPTTDGPLCPRCFKEDALHASGRNIGLFLLGTLLLTLVAIGMHIGNNPLRFLLTNIAAIYPLWIITQFLYAGIQWLVSLLVGGQLFILNIGYGPKLIETDILGTQLSIGRFQNGVTYRFAPKSSSRRRLSTSIFYGLPIFIHTLIVIALLPAFDPDTVRNSYAFPLVFLLTSGYLLYTIAYPNRLSIGGASVNNNAANLLQVINEQISPTDLQANYLSYAADRALDTRRTIEGLEHTKRGLEIAPKHLMLTLYHGALLEKSGRVDEAIEYLTPALDRYLHPSAERASVLNNLAWYHLTGSGDQAAAFNLAKEAYHLLPWESAIESTWGSVLIMDEEIDDGLYHLKESLKLSNTSKESQATTLAFMALGYHRKGKKGKAKEYIQRALINAPNSHVVKHAQLEIS
ncbi:MAG: tetratricopeptide repeat protein [Chloroflexota bacterium]